MQKPVCHKEAQEKSKGTKKLYKQKQMNDEEKT